MVFPSYNYTNVTALTRVAGEHTSNASHASCSASNVGRVWCGLRATSYGKLLGKAALTADFSIWFFCLQQFVAGDLSGAVGVLDLAEAVAAEADPGGSLQPSGDALPGKLQAVVGFANGFVIDELDDIRIKVTGLDQVGGVDGEPGVEYFDEACPGWICRLDFGNAIDRITAAQGQDWIAAPLAPHLVIAERRA